MRILDIAALTDDQQQQVLKNCCQIVPRPSLISFTDTVTLLSARPVSISISVSICVGMATITDVSVFSVISSLEFSVQRSAVFVIIAFIAKHGTITE
jgi:hypothetical protein